MIQEISSLRCRMGSMGREAQSLQEAARTAAAELARVQQQIAELDTELEASQEPVLTARKQKLEELLAVAGEQL